jgi:4-alpha-glucanotransferase
MAPEFNSDLVEFDLIKKWRLDLMAKAANSFRINRSNLQFKQFLDYCNQNEYWLQNYSVFNILEKIHNSENWINWNSKYKTFSKDILNQIQESHSQELDDIKILQYLFDCQWSELKFYANSKGIQIIGDIPIYVSFNSADVWANQSLFKLSNKGDMIVQSGTPPDIL